MQSFHYGKRTLFRLVFAVIDRCCSPRRKPTITLDQHANMVALAPAAYSGCWQNAAFEGISMDYCGLAASVRGDHTSGVIEVNGEKSRLLRGNRFGDGAPLTVYPAKCLRVLRRDNVLGWAFQFEAFRHQVMDVDKPLPHIRLDAALEFLIGDSCDERTVKTAY